MRKLGPAELGRLSLNSFKEASKLPLVFILDNVRSGLNVGSVFRTADGFLFQELALCGITALPPHREILKTAIGATESVYWSHFDDTATAIAHYRQKGYQILGIELTDDSIALHQFEVDKKQAYALVLGNEVDGIDDQVLPLLDACIEIPQLGTKHSLNVSVCAGIIAWSFAKTWLD